PSERYPAAIPAIAFAVGIALAPRLVDPWIATGGIALCALLLAARARWTSRASRTLPVAVFIFLSAGLAIATAANERTARDLRDLASLDRDQFRAVLIPLERGWEVTGETARVRARSFALVTEEEETDRRRRSLRAVDRAEERVEIPITLTLWDEPPASTAMAAAIRAEGFLLCQSDGCRMNVKSARLVAPAGSLPRWHPASWNRNAAQRIASLGARSELARRGAAQASALALGRGELLDDEVREAYRRGGTYHLLVFSGMQIALAAGILAWAFRRAGRPRPGDWALLAIALIAPPFAGHDPSVSRASVMIGCYAASRLLRRPTSPSNLLFVSALFRLSFSPGELDDPGFALTWGATGGLLLIGGALAARCRGAIARALAFGVGAELGTTPITAFFFHQIVIGSSVITLLLSPLLSLMVGIAAIACASAFAAPGLALALLETVGRLDIAAVAANRWIADAAGVARVVAAPPAAIVGGSILAALIAILRFARYGPLVAAAALLVPPVASVAIERARARVDGFEMTVIDVGQGEAILLREGRDSILVDGGGRRGDPTFGRRVIVPWLADHGVRRPGVIVMTHPDPDHCAGLVTVVDLLGAGEVWLSSRHVRAPCAAQLVDAAQRRRIPVRLADRRSPSREGRLRLRIISAEPPFRRSVHNNTSLVAALSVGGRRFLITGDIEKAAEFRLLEQGPDLLTCDVLKVAHHGSASSSAAAFLARARPRIAAISCGRENSYGHPSPEVLERLSDRGARVLRTDLHGTITFSVRGGRLFALRQIDTPAGADSLVPGGRTLHRRTMSSFFIRLGLYAILVMLAVFVAGQTFDLPYAEYLTSTHLGQVGLAGIALIAAGAVLRVFEKVRRKTKKGKGRCVICKRPVLVGDKYCREHLRQMIGEEQDQERMRVVPPRR
ncbi:MAG TPA: DNA internalization-related competence protein ComEC/Rec2, partial [Thermoanaerobaculia bacterium]|nr:DNA internalization-related competence protein ComEC/Rec2 [Thermoanaerobaculia bacterium]